VAAVRLGSSLISIFLVNGTTLKCGLERVSSGRKLAGPTARLILAYDQIRLNRSLPTNRPASLPVKVLNAFRVQPSPAKEVTAIPVGPADGFYGAMAFFAVLTYPGTDSASHSRRDRLIEAMQDWISGWKKGRLGFRRITTQRLNRVVEAGIRRRQSMKNDAVFRLLNRAERIVVERRLLAAQIAEHLAGLSLSRELERGRSRLRIRISGPQSLTSAIEHLAAQTATTDTSTLWRLWRESLPVLHLACAFYFLQPKQQDNDRQGVILRCVRDHHLWLVETLRSAEGRAPMLPCYTRFDPLERVSLIPE